MKKQPIRVLVVEDLPDDAELLILKLRQQGFEPDWQRVQTESDFLAAIETPFDLILADYTLPAFSGLQALGLLKERGLDIPLIIVSGTIGEDVAIRAIKQGAYDYLLKDKLTRLGSSVRNALQDKELRDQKKAAQEALRENEVRFRKLIENAPDAFSLLGVDGRVKYASPSTRRLLGYTPEEVIGVNPAEATHPDDLSNLLAVLSDLIQNPEKTVTIQYRFRHKDGSWRWLESVLTNMLGEPGVEAIVFNYRDITERRQAGEALAHEQYLMHTLMDNIPDAVYFKDKQGRFIRVNRSTVIKHGLSDPEQLVGKTDFDFFEKEYAQKFYQEEWNILQTGEPLPEQEELEIWPDRPPTWASTIKMPLRDQTGEIVGTFGVSRDITERKQRENELKAIAAVSAALRRASNHTDMAPIILDQIFDLLEIAAAALAMRDPVTGDTVIELARGAWSGGTGRRIPAGEGISGQVINSGQPYSNNDITTDPHYLPPLSGSALPAAACVPLIAQEQTIGALWIARTRPISPTDLQLLTAISNIAASAIHRATLFEQTQRRLQQISALHSIDIAISSSFDLRFTLNILLEQVTSHLNVDATDILLLNPYSQMLEYVAGRGFHSSAVDRLSIRLGEGRAGQAVLERRTVSIPNLQADESRLGRGEFLAAEKFVCYYGVPLIAKGQIKGLLEIFHRNPLSPDPDWLSFLETLADQAAIAINDAAMFDTLQRSNTELVLAYDATIEGWSRALDLRDNETEGHTQRVTETTLKLARILRLNETELVHIRRGALLHDIGKMGIPDSILLKPGELTPEEWEVMHRHPVYAYELIKPIEFLRPALDIPYCHHERWDGTGYPRGLKAEHIPLAARIFALADVWDALRSDRPYRKAWSNEKTREYITSESGKHFDPTVVDVFLRMEDLV